jgi:hypothetical protein
MWELCVWCVCVDCMQSVCGVRMDCVWSAYGVRMGSGVYGERCVWGVVCMECMECWTVGKCYGCVSYEKHILLSCYPETSTEVL